LHYCTGDVASLLALTLYVYILCRAEKQNRESCVKDDSKLQQLDFKVQISKLHLMTEKEIVSQHRKIINFIDVFHSVNESSSSEIADMIPGMVHLNSAADFQLTYINDFLLNFFDRNLEEIRKEDVDFLPNRLHPETTETVMPYFADFYKSQDENAVCSAIQKVRPDFGFDYKPILSSTKISMDKKSFFTISIPFEELGKVGKKLEKVLEIDSFYTANFELFQSLSKREKQLVGLFCKGLTNREIGEVLFVSANTVRTHRNNIFRKLSIKRIGQLLPFGKAF
jgi:DNA-binding CsgD family transcriptional regulator